MKFGHSERHGVKVRIGVAKLSGNRLSIRPVKTHGLTLPDDVAIVNRNLNNQIRFPDLNLAS